MLSSTETMLQKLMEKATEFLGILIKLAQKELNDGPRT